MHLPTRHRFTVVSVVSLVALTMLVAGPAMATTPSWSGPVTVVDGATEVVSSVVAPDGAIIGTVETSTGVGTVTSHDAGVTWAAPVYVGSGGVAAFRSTIAVTSSGLLAVAWVQQDASSNRLIYVVTSTDDGATWGTPVALPTISNYQDDPQLAPTGPHSFTAAWSEGFDKLASATTDSGATWSTAVYLSQAMNSYGTVDLVPDGAGDIVAIFQEFDGGANQFSIQSRRSTDGGVTWNGKVAVSPSWSGSLGNGIYAFGVAPTTGSLIAVWSRGVAASQQGLFAATSTDGGNSWGAPFAVFTPADFVRNFTVQSINSTTAAVVWHYELGGASFLDYATITLGDTATSTPVAINPDTTVFYAHQPSLSVLGNTRVVSWLQTGATDADTAYRVATSCDAGATWSAPSDVAVGADLATQDTLSTVSGSTFTTFWGSFGADLNGQFALASSAADPCHVAAPAALAKTGSAGLDPAILLLGIALFGAGATVVAVRRRRAA